jgi:micrococcal nuclease
MKRFLPFAVIAVLFAGLAADTYVRVAPAPAPQITTDAGAPRTRYETVQRVVDGDTFLLAPDWTPYHLEFKVRVRHIDTPEHGSLAHCAAENSRALDATRFTDEWLHATGMRVHLENVEHDKYGGRVDADVYNKRGQSLADALLKAGLARPYNGGAKSNWCN